MSDELFLEQIECGPMQNFVYAIGSNATFTYVPAEFLQEQGVRGWRHMPIWLPPTGPTAGFLRRDVSKAIAAGLTYRPLADTAKVTLAWHKSRPEAEQKAMLEIMAEKLAELHYIPGATVPA